MNMLKLKLLTENDVFQEIHVNPTMIGAVLPSPREGLTRIIMSGGQVLDVEEYMELLLARLALIMNARLLFLAGVICWCILTTGVIIYFGGKMVCS